MGKVTGDKARYNRERRKKIARRAQMRALRAAAEAKGSATAAPKAATTPKA